MAKLDKSKIYKSILEGIENAHSTYGKMSGFEGFRLAGAPEHFLSCQIAQQVASIGTCYLTLEADVRDTMEFAGAHSMDKLSTDIRVGRFDIVVWDKGKEGEESKPRAVIEVKHCLYDADYKFEKDVKRILDSLHINQETKGSLQFGCFAFWTAAEPPVSKYKSASHQIKEKTKKIHETAILIANNKFNVSMQRTIHEEEGEWAWAAVVLAFEPTKSA